MMGKDKGIVSVIMQHLKNFERDNAINEHKDATTDHLKKQQPRRD